MNANTTDMAISHNTKDDLAIPANLLRVKNPEGQTAEPTVEGNKEYVQVSEDIPTQALN